MDRVRALVQERLAVLGLKPGPVSKRAGLSEAFLWQYLHKSKQKSLGEEAREALAPILGVTPDDLKEERRRPSINSSDSVLRSSFGSGKGEPNQVVGGKDSYMHQALEDILRIALRKLDGSRVLEIMAEESKNKARRELPPQKRG
jgi:transcriptional regulator with XRE-family HTH domain